MAYQDYPIEQAHRPVVLAVDDQAVNLAVASAMLEALNVDVRVADSGPAALRYAELEPQPDLILLDVMMPDMDGHEVLARLRANPCTKNIPVIFVTALDSPQDEGSGLLEGAVDYIAKPLQAEIFRARVRTHLELKQVRDRLARHNADLEQEVERRVAENSQLGARLQMTLSASGLGIWEYHFASEQMAWNHDLCRMLGVSTAPAGLAAVLDMTHPEDRSRIEDILRAPPHPGADVLITEFRMRHASGHWLWLEGRGQSLELDGQGQAGKMGGTIADISRASRSKLNASSSVVFTGISDGICITDPG
jgi:PAS domain S-box-containing protein